MSSRQVLQNTASLTGSEENCGLVRRTNLKRLLAPKHVAMVGGRGNETAIHMLRAAGFRGEVWPVHPSHRQITGLDVFASVRDLPEPPDATFLNIPARAMTAIVRDLANMGAGGAVGYSAGFAELGDTGREAQRALVEAAGNLALIGPNSNGLLNTLDGLALWAIQSHSPPRLEKGVAILSSSGGVLVNYAANQRSVHSGVMIAVGNQAVTGFANMIDLLADDPRIEAIGLFAEDLGDPVHFSRAAEHAARQGVPIVALKTGRTARSAALAATHSGAMIAPDDMIEALFQRCGVIRVDSLPEFDETLKMLTVPIMPKGRKIAALTIAGGEKALLLDAAERTRLEFSDISASACESLEQQIPEFASVSNPFDFNPHYTGTDVLAMDNRASLEKCFETVLADGFDIGLLLVTIRSKPEGGEGDRSTLFTETVNAFTSVCQRLDIPGSVLSVMPEHLPFQWREKLISDGIAPLMGLNEGVKAIDNAIGRSERRARLLSDEIALPKDEVRAGARTLVDEASAKSVLGALGLPLPPSRIAANIEEALNAAEEIGFPVVLKVLDPVIAHKAKAGGVILSLTSGDEVRAAVRSISKALECRGGPLRKLLVERMVQGAKKEVIIGIKHEPGFGHALVLGSGGVEVESLDRPDMILLPASAESLASFVFSARVLSGASEETRQAVLRAAQAAVAYWKDHRRQLLGMDINPLIIDRDGGVTAVDALLELGGDA